MCGRSFCLVDSSWRPSKPGPGVLTVRFKLDRGSPMPVFRASVVAARTSTGDQIGTMEPVLPDLAGTVQAPWVHLDRPPMPGNTPTSIGNVIWEVIQTHPNLKNARPQKLNLNNDGRLLAVSYPMEVGFEQEGIGWLFILWMGKDTLPRGKSAPRVIQTLRAGPDDLMVRNPDASRLAGKTIAIVGVGALGGLLALELAKNGCSHLHLVDRDVVEPGNSVRWVAGCPAWGVGKSEALKAIIEEHWPGCRVTSHPHMVGTASDLAATPASPEASRSSNGREGRAMPIGDTELSEAVFERCDLVVDGTASYAPTLWLADECRRLGIPLVSLMATPDVGAGTVALFAPGGGCPRCLEHAQHRGSVPEFGTAQLDPNLQPPGCSERTFIGASYDLEELSLQAARMVLAAFAPGEGSLVATLRLEAHGASLRLPKWQLHGFGTCEECGCHLHQG